MMSATIQAHVGEEAKAFPDKNLIVLSPGLIRAGCVETRRKVGCLQPALQCQHRATAIPAGIISLMTTLDVFNLVVHIADPRAALPN